MEKALLTQLTVGTSEVFQHYQHNSDSVADVTFNLKDFKQMLSLCESLNASVAIRFDQPGSPLVVEPVFRDPNVGIGSSLARTRLVSTNLHDMLCQT